MGIDTSINQSGGGGVSGNCVLVENKTLASEVGTVTFSDLDINTHGTYMLVFHGKQINAGAGSNVAMYFNGDTTATNYYTQGNEFNNTSTSFNRNNNALCVLLGIGDGSFVAFISRGVDGKVIVQVRTQRGSASALEIFDAIMTTAGNLANLTEIALTGTANFSVGSCFSLYKLTEA